MSSVQNALWAGPLIVWNEGLLREEMWTVNLVPQTKLVFLRKVLGAGSSAGRALPSHGTNRVFSLFRNFLKYLAF